MAISLVSALHGTFTPTPYSSQAKMKSFVSLALLGGALAARPFLWEPDTGIDDALGDSTPNGTLANLTQLVGLPDFQWAARRYLPPANYTYYINGVSGEWSARNNLEVFYRYSWKPRQLVDITKIAESLP